MNFRTCMAKLESISPYSQSGFFVSEKKTKETHEAFEKRCWKEKAHVNGDGIIVIPAMAFKYSIDEAAKRLQIQIPGKGKTQYTKYIEAGVAVQKDVPLGIKFDDIQGETIWAHPDGKRGSGKRVRRTFPLIPEWKGTLEIMVFDETVTDEILERVLESAGVFVGVGRFRPEKQGYFGRWRVVGTKWSEV